MILSDRDIPLYIDAGLISISSENSEWENHINASSIDLHLGTNFKSIAQVQNVSCDSMIHLCSGKLGIVEYSSIECSEECPYILPPNGFVLATTVETVSIGNKIVGRVEGRSSVGRLGLMIHCTAGFIDAGFSGTITLELYNASGKNIALYPWFRICQIAFETMSSPALVPYGEKKGAKYQNQSTTQGSLVSLDL